jgi:hypothetical protein
VVIYFCRSGRMMRSGVVDVGMLNSRQRNVDRRFIAK